MGGYAAGATSARKRSDAMICSAESSYAWWAANGCGRRSGCGAGNLGTIIYRREPERLPDKAHWGLFPPPSSPEISCAADTTRFAVSSTDSDSAVFT